MGYFSSQTCILQESTPKTNSAPFGHGNLGFSLTIHGGWGGQNVDFQRYILIEFSLYTTDAEPACAPVK